MTSMMNQSLEPHVVQSTCVDIFGYVRAVSYLLVSLPQRLPILRSNFLTIVLVHPEFRGALTVAPCFLSNTATMLEFKPTIPSSTSSEAEGHVEPMSSSFDTKQVHTSRFRRLWSSLCSIPLCFSNRTLTPSEVRSWNLHLHATSLLFAIPCLVLTIVDLQTYMQNHEHARNQSNANPIALLDGFALTFFALTIIYAVAYHLAAHLSGDVDHSSRNNTSFVYQTPLALFLIDILLMAAVTAIADTILAMRSEIRNCGRWADVDSGICEGWRINIMCAAGASGVVLR
jgi:hypothetical protein